MHLNDVENALANIKPQKHRSYVKVVVRFVLPAVLLISLIVGAYWFYSSGSIGYFNSVAIEF